MTRKNGHPDMSLEFFDEVIECVYDSALDPGRWRQAIGMISDLSRSHFGALAVIDLERNRHELAYDKGYSNHFRQLYEEKHGAMNPYLGRLMHLPIATVATQSMLIDDDEFANSSVYEEFVKPLKICDAIGFNVLKTRQQTTLLAAHRRESEGCYEIADIKLLRLLAPHICRSMAISQMLNFQRIRSEAFETTLKALKFGICLTDREGKIVFLNRAGDHQVRTSDALRIHNSRLAPIDREARATLTNAVLDAAAAEDETSASQVTTIALPGDENSGLVATILPLNRGARAQFFGNSGPAAAVFIQDPHAEQATCDGGGFASLYDLTPSEVRVLLALSRGLGIKHVTDTLGINRSTAKTHLQHIYAKTGTSRQTELMRSFLGSTPPIESAPQPSTLSAVPRNRTCGSAVIEGSPVRRGRRSSRAAG